jgi:signal peptidase
MLNSCLPDNSVKIRCLVLFFPIVTFCLLNNLSIEGLTSGILNLIIKPLLWCGAIVIIRFFPEARSSAPLRLRDNILWFGVLFAVIFVLVQFCSGFIFSFGKSPYDLSVTGILFNIISIGAFTVGRESVRSYFTNSILRKENYLLFIAIALFMTLINYKVSEFSALKNAEDVVKFLAQNVVPDFCHNLLATYLCFLGGVAPAAAYMCILQAFNWLSPILPNLQWITKALIGIMCPIFSLTAVQSYYLREIKAVRRFKRESESPVGWMLTCIMSIGIIWFSVGVFPVYPSVIATGSMEPVIYPGDVILIEKVHNNDVEKLAIGDIIQFRVENFMVSHRIIEVIEGEQGVYYRTKGDNNNAPDSQPVLPQNIKGRVVRVVPKIGWPTLLIRQKQDNVQI